MKFKIDKASEYWHDHKPHYKEIRTIEEFKEMEEEAGYSLIISFNPPEITIYDDDIE